MPPAQVCIAASGAAARLPSRALPTPFPPPRSPLPLTRRRPSPQLPVTETAADIRANFLDLIYDRSAAITPDNVLHVLDLADKYAAPRLIEACGAVMASSSFFLTGPEPPTALEGNCDALEALALARKHDFHALAARCRLCIQQAATLSLEHALEYFNANAAAIAALELPDVVGVLQVRCILSVCLLLYGAFCCSRVGVGASAERRREGCACAERDLGRRHRRERAAHPGGRLAGRASGRRGAGGPVQGGGRPVQEELRLAAGQVQQAHREGQGRRRVRRCC